MSKSPEVKPQKGVKKTPTFQFNIYQSEDNKDDYTGEYLRDGVLKQSLHVPNSFQYISTVLGMHLRLAIHE